MTTAHQILRSGTAARHDAIDAAFSAFDLGDRASYGTFLLAQARALLAIESRLLEEPGLPPWRPRAHLIEADLHALGLALPAPLPFDLTPAQPGALHGMLYVLEGSRLGGGMLVRQVGPDLPTAFLGATHLKGEWRGFLGALDAAAENCPAEFMAAAVAGANQAFDLYAKSVEAVPAG